MLEFNRWSSLKYTHSQFSLSIWGVEWKIWDFSFYMNLRFLCTSSNFQGFSSKPVFIWECTKWNGFKLRAEKTIRPDYVSVAFFSYSFLYSLGISAPDMNQFQFLNSLTKDCRVVLFEKPLKFKEVHKNRRFIQMKSHKVFVPLFNGWNLKIKPWFRLS